MPLTPVETFVFPEGLLEAGETGSTATAGSWWVLHTRPRAEKAVARKVLSRQVPFFLPLYEKKWRSRGRLLTAHLPLFTGYLFLHGTEDQRRIALETNQVAQCLPVPDQRQLKADLVRVYQIMLSGAPLSPEGRLEPGTRVAIVRGPLAGLEGTLRRRGKHLKIYVEVQFLHQGATAEVEEWMIEPRDGPPPLPTRGG